jgi:hypothetical protein
MNVIRSAVVEQGGKRYVEYDFADAATMMDARQYVRFRIEIGSQGHPPIVKTLLEGLGAVRVAKKVVVCQLWDLLIREARSNRRLAYCGAGLLSRQPLTLGAMRRAKDLV